jgi:uncharacterized protein YukE
MCIMVICSLPMAKRTTRLKKRRLVIEEAQAGWVGASAAALQAKLAEWQSVTAELCTDVAAHSEAFRSAAAGYETTDADSAEALNNQL